MDVIENFEYRLVKWLCDHGFSNVDVNMAVDFGYYRDSHAIDYSLFVQEGVDKEFERFFYEYGCQHNDVPNFVISFLHELGHHMTLPSFTEEEYADLKDTLELAHVAVNANPKTREYFNLDWYWHQPHEFAANIWAINYVNEHYDDVLELTAIVCDGINAMYNDEEVRQGVYDWLAMLEEEAVSQ